MRITRARVAFGGLFFASALALVAVSAVVNAQALQRSLRVTVVDQSGNDVPNLGPADFVVKEDKATREVLRVQPANEPMQIALLVDDSPAVTQYLRDVRSAATAFVTAITSNTPANGAHQIALVTLSSRPTIKTNYTSDSKALLYGTDCGRSVWFTAVARRSVLP